MTMAVAIVTLLWNVGHIPVVVILAADVIVEVEVVVFHGLW